MANFPYQDSGTITLASGVTMNNPFVILTHENIVEILGRFTVANFSNGMQIGTMAACGIPSVPMRIPVLFNGSNTPGHIEINDVGAIYARGYSGSTMTNRIIYTNGICYNISNNYYNSTYDNITPYGPTEGFPVV